MESRKQWKVEGRGSVDHSVIIIRLGCDERITISPSRLVLETLTLTSSRLFNWRMSMSSDPNGNINDNLDVVSASGFWIQLVRWL